MAPGDVQLQRLPIVDWNDLSVNRAKFLRDVLHALETIGFMVLVNHPDFSDSVQKRLFKEVRGFFDAPLEEKKKAHIARTPYFRGYSGAPSEKLKGRQSLKGILAQEAFQYGFEREPVSAHDDPSEHIFKRVFTGPNTWPDEVKFPGFRPSVDYLTDKYHRLTHDLGRCICEAVGLGADEFERHYDLNDPYLAGSLNHNLGKTWLTPEMEKKVEAEFANPRSLNTGAHIDGAPFVALLINDRPGLQVVAGENRWINAPVTCRTAEGAYDTDVIPGSVVINSGGMLMQITKGRIGGTLHRVNPLLVPRGETRVSMPYFLLPKLGKVDPSAGYDRWVGASVNRMSTFPQTTRRWWQSMFEELHANSSKSYAAITQKAYDAAASREKRNRTKSHL
eukprot:Hpha_TRINITY_DN15035_c4_g17::TRINITY_DN15035_c4_g17_i1::g.123175::m.123175